MKKADIGHHISQKYNQELEDVRNKVLHMGGLVEQQLADAVLALTTMDGALAEVVITNDYKINRLEVEIDDECIHILARRQPAAGDLRLLMAIIKTITDLERIGDEAERVGRMALRFIEGETTKDTKPLLGIGYFGDHVRRSLHAALDAFARMDVYAATQTAKEDIKIDQEYEGILRQLMTYMMEDPRSIPRVIGVMWSARALERIGDRARNICEYVIYLVGGKDVRHISLEQVEAEVRASHRDEKKPS
ncbi:MAG: phosphate signaling complex protein PhoU [Gammaproteobacteria bacterium]|nr:phosphate signaling complex protein PhoU [Gammaproteobacteria bacterium]